MGRYTGSGYVNLGTGTNISARLDVTGGKNANTSPTGATCTWTVPTGVTCATFEVWGGGGAGGTRCCNDCYGGVPGAPGGYTTKTISVTPGTQYVLVAGAGGSGNSPPSMAPPPALSCAGETSYVTGSGLTSFCATGGAGGYRCTNCLNMGTFMAGGQGYGGDLCASCTPRYTYNDQCADITYCGIRVGQGPMFGGQQMNWTVDSVYGTNGQASYLCHGQNGNFPGGGGGPNTTCCCLANFEQCPGHGANGLVRVTW